MPRKSSPNRKNGSAKTDNPQQGRFDWLGRELVAALVAALIGASAVILAALIAHPISITSLFSHKPPETEFDRPRSTTSPRTAFCFFMPNPPAGYRRMVKGSGNVWLETQPDNVVLQHEVVGRVNYGPWRGVILRRLENRDPYP